MERKIISTTTKRIRKRITRKTMFPKTLQSQYLQGFTHSNVRFAPLDFESTTSANSITPASIQIPEGKVGKVLEICWYKVQFSPLAAR